MRTGIKPFSRSANRVNAAAFFPAILSTLVAPGLFDPSLLGSGNPMTLLNVIAVEKDPSR